MTSRPATTASLCRRSLAAASLMISLFAATSTLAAPARIVIIRHAEKTADSGQELSERGFERARALVSFFSSDPRIVTYGQPVAVYASAPKNPGSAWRTIQTVTPLAASLNVAVQQEFTKKEYAELAASIMEESGYEGKMVVVCWQHGEIPDLAHAFGANDAPYSWDNDTYDRAWILDFKDGNVSFQDLPQHVLSGDSDSFH